MVCAAISQGALAADWRVTPSLSFQEVVTDNVGQSEFDRRADAISQLIPGITVTGDSPRGQVLLSYAPIFSKYLAESGQDRVDQNLYGNGSLDIIDRLLSADFSVFANQGSGSGSFGSTGASGLVPLNDRTLNYGGTVAPHLRQRFGDVATFDAYYRVSTSNTTGNDQFDTRYGDVPNNLLQQEAQVIVGSGNSFGRLSSELNLEHMTGSGSGANNQFSNDLDIVKLEYHLTHKYAVTGYIGYQGIHYEPTSTTSGYDNSGLTWNAGVDITPNDFTTIQLGYGRQSGAYGLNAHIKYDLTPRTHIWADYSIAVENQLQSNLQNIQFLGRDTLGNPIDLRNGTPFINSGNLLFGDQNTLFRDKVASISFSREFIRSSLTLTAGNERRQPLSGGTSADTAWYGNVTYSRELTPSLRGYADLGYSLHDYGGLADGSTQHDRLINADVSLSYQINPTLVATTTYSLFRRDSNVSGYSSTTNQIMIGIRKDF